MSTEAGKHWAESPDWWLIEGEREQARECIAAIEAETAEAHEAVLRVRGWRDECEAATDAAMNYGDGQAAERARIAEAFGRLRDEGSWSENEDQLFAAALAIVNGESTANNDKVSREGAERPPSCEHDWQRSGPVSDGHLFCPDCGGHKDEDNSERPPSCEQHPEDY